MIIIKVDFDGSKVIKKALLRQFLLFSFYDSSLSGYWCWAKEIYHAVRDCHTQNLKSSYDNVGQLESQLTVWRRLIS